MSDLENTTTPIENIENIDNIEEPTEIEQPRKKKHVYSDTTMFKDTDLTFRLTQCVITDSKEKPVFDKKKDSDKLQWVHLPDETHPQYTIPNNAFKLLEARREEIKKQKEEEEIKKQKEEEKLHGKEEKTEEKPEEKPEQKTDEKKLETKPDPRLEPETHCIRMSDEELEFLKSKYSGLSEHMEITWVHYFIAGDVTVAYEDIVEQGNIQDETFRVISNFVKNLLEDMASVADEIGQTSEEKSAYFAQNPLPLEVHPEIFKIIIDYSKYHKHIDHPYVVKDEENYEYEDSSDEESDDEDREEPLKKNNVPEWDIKLLEKVPEYQEKRIAALTKDEMIKELEPRTNYDKIPTLKNLSEDDLRKKLLGYAKLDTICKVFEVANNLHFKQLYDTCAKTLATLIENFIDSVEDSLTGTEEEKEKERIFRLNDFMGVKNDIPDTLFEEIVKENLLIKNAQNSSNN